MIQVTLHLAADREDLSKEARQIENLSRTSIDKIVDLSDKLGLL